jgi:hypothetical protein
LTALSPHFGSEHDEPARQLAEHVEAVEMRKNFIGGFMVWERGDIEVKVESGRYTRRDGKQQAP